MLVYNENQVYKLTAYYGYQIDLEMGTDEDIKTIASGDSVGWQIVGAGHHIFIKPMADHARTNLSIVTSRRIYVFDLMASPVSDLWQMTYLVRFQYPHTDPYVNSSSTGKKASDFNFDYKITGNKSLRPSRVFDDGEFTYFQFRHQRNRELPAIFLVDVDKKESLINYRMEGDYVVVERLGEQFYLRSGNSKAIVVNRYTSSEEAMAGE
jgi:type IV secretion system protein VirB9